MSVTGNAVIFPNTKSPKEPKTFTCYTTIIQILIYSWRLTEWNIFPDTSSFIYVNVSETWVNAQSYCRVKHTDLASVRNQSENEQLKMMLNNSPTWIGLYRNSWMWSDGSAYSFPNWAPNKPLSDDTYSCGTIYLEKWHNSACNGYNYFLCYTGELSFVLATI